ETHLALITHHDVMNDRRIHNNIPIGEENARAIITEETAKQIIASRLPVHHPDYLTQVQRATKFSTTRGVVSQIDCNTNWKHLPRSYIVPKKRKREQPAAVRTTRDPQASISEEMALSIIASKKHKYDPQYKTQRQRAEELGVSISIINDIDANHNWRYLPRPEIVVFPKPDYIWDEDALNKAFERVKKHCKYSENVNEFTGSKCLEWQDALKKGVDRPIITIHRKQQFAYNFACEYREKRVKPEDSEARHLCGNKICCEPSHLKFGTKKENGEDIVVHAKSRSFKYTKEQILDIREKYETGQMKQVDLAREYGTNKVYISNIVRKKVWSII